MKNKAFKHFKLITTHKAYVFKNCVKARLFWRGIKHDMSKYSPVEFFESVKYFTGTDSPINTCKKAKGWSKAWMHHKGRNTHHFEYYIDNFDNGGVALKMPYKDALEMICDYIAAGQAYQKKEFTYKGEYEWWQNKSKGSIAMHPDTKRFVDIMLRTMANEENNDCLRPIRAKHFYNISSIAMAEV